MKWQRLEMEMIGCNSVFNIKMQVQQEMIDAEMRRLLFLMINPTSEELITLSHYLSLVFLRRAPSAVCACCQTAGDLQSLTADLRHADASFADINLWDSV